MAWLGKGRGTVARLAGVLELLAWSALGSSVPPLLGLGVELIGVFRVDLGQRHTVFAVRDAGASERSVLNRHDEIAQTGRDHLEG